MSDSLKGPDVGVLSRLGLASAGPVFGLSNVTYPVFLDVEVSNDSSWMREYRRVQLDAQLNRVQMRNAISEARDRALREMLSHASVAGMDGVLNVQFSAQVLLESSAYWGVSFRASGYGVRRLAGSSVPAGLFSATFGAAELLLLSGRGLWPVQALVASVPTAHQWEGSAYDLYDTFEMVDVTFSVQRSRGKATADLQRSAKLLNADGVLGIEMALYSGKWLEPSHEHLLSGTAVRKVGLPVLATEREAPLMIMSLDD